MRKIGYGADLGNSPEVFPGKTKRRVYDEQRRFLGNYKTVLGKGDAAQKAIGKDLDGCLASGPFAESELRDKYHKVLLNSLGRAAQDLAKPDVGTLADATQGGANQKIRLTTQPTRPSLADALRVLDILNNPTAEKWHGTSSQRRVITPDSERGLVSIMGPDGLFYANAVGTFGAVSACRNWDRLASAFHRWALKLVDKRKVFLLLFPTARFS